MSSNITVQRICQNCGKEFTARTTVTMYCSHRCGSMANKAKKRAEKVQKSNIETKQVKTLPIEELKAKEFLSVRDVSILLGCSIRTTYRLIDNGTLKAVNLAERITRIKKSNLNKILDQPEPEPIGTTIQFEFDISDCYTISEIQSRYNISEKAIYNIINRNNIPKIKKGRFAYVPKSIIDNLLN